MAIDKTEVLTHAIQEQVWVYTARHFLVRYWTIIADKEFRNNNVRIANSI